MWSLGIAFSYLSPQACPNIVLLPGAEWMSFIFGRRNMKRSTSIYNADYELLLIRWRR